MILPKYSFFNFLKNRIKNFLGEAVSTLKINVNFDEFGDFSLPLFGIAKKLNKGIDEVATIIKDELKDLTDFNLIYKNGYLNFHLQALQIVRNPKNEYVYKNENPLNCVFEFSSPNIAKPFSIGHLRSTDIGWALSNVFESAEDKVIRINYLGDWGTQFGKLIYAYQNFNTQEPPTLDTLTNLYVKFHTEAQKNPLLEEKAREIFKQLENKDEKLLKLWQKFYNISMEYFNKIYNKLGVRFDVFEGESFYTKNAKELTELLLAKKIAEVSQDAVIVDLQNEKLGVAILQKKDGSTIYLARDLATIIERFKKFNFDKIFYIVGKEQILHFKQLIKIATLFEPKLSEKIVHIPFGHFRFGGEKIATREGNIVYFEDVLKKGIEKVKEIVSAREEVEKTDEALYEKIALSAIKYYDLKNSIEKDIDFSWEEALNFDGNTGPYILYGLVRLKSLLRKFEEKFGKKVQFQNIEFSQIEKSPQLSFLLRKALLFYDFVLLCKNTAQPYILCNYLFDLLKTFNNFYERVRIITSEIKESETNLFIVEVLKEVVSFYICLLGLEELEIM
jgi:arginyl-tRNA synthetase